MFYCWKSFPRCEESLVVKVELPLLSPGAESSAPEEPDIDDGFSFGKKEDDQKDAVELLPLR